MITDNLLPPLLVHKTLKESHYHRLIPSSAAYPRPILLHAHTSAPFINTNPRRGLNLTIYTTGEQLEDGCFPYQLELRVDWWSTIGRWVHRYWPAVISWPVGIVSLLLWRAWGATESGEGKFLFQPLASDLKSIIYQ
jgi:GPI inositol-deacylase